MDRRFNRLLEGVRGELKEANTPQQVADMLRQKIQGAQKLYDALKQTSYVEYNIGDFFKSDLPKLRKTSDTITKQKAVLEAQLYRFLRQAKADLKAVEKEAQ